MAPPSEDPPNVGTILYRLDAMEQRRAEDRRHLDAAVAEIKAEMRAGLASIAYVSKEQFADFKAAVAARDEETRAIAGEARKLALACLWVLIVAVVGGIVGLAFQVAS
jgi:hypothetical protein